MCCELEPKNGQREDGCDEFISDDRDQQNCLREVASLAKLAVKVRWFKEFCGSFEVDQLSSGAGCKKTAS